MDVRLGKKIGEGGCSEVFEWEDQTKIIKLAKANTYPDAMKNEFRNHLLAWEAKLPVPKPFEIIELNGRIAIVLERIHGKTMMLRFQEHVMNGVPNDVAGEDIRITAHALYEIHSRTSLSLPDKQRDPIKHAIHIAPYLSLTEKENIIVRLDRLAAKSQICHGDPNPGNFIIQENGKPMIIDWMNASMGNPEADLAEYIIMMRYSVLPDEVPEPIVAFFDTVREAIIQQFMTVYHQLSGIDYEAVVPWMIPVAARKLSVDGISRKEKEKLVHFIRGSLHAS